MAYVLTGQLEINKHCKFPCEEIEGVMHRRVHIRPEHCARCLGELVRLAARCAFRLVDDRPAAAKASLA